MSKAKNSHVGQLFDDFLREEGIYEEVQIMAVKRELALQLEDAMKAAKLSKSEMTRSMQISSTQLDCLLDPDNQNVTLDTLARAAAVVGRKLRLEMV